MRTDQHLFVLESSEAEDSPLHSAGVCWSQTRREGFLPHVTVEHTRRTHHSARYETLLWPYIHCLPTPLAHSNPHTHTHTHLLLSQKTSQTLPCTKEPFLPIHSLLLMYHYKSHTLNQPLSECVCSHLNFFSTSLSKSGPEKVSHTNTIEHSSGTSAGNLRPVSE